MTRQPTHGASISGDRNGKPWKDPMAPAAEVLIEATLAEHPWLERPEFASALRAWAFAEVRVERVQAWLDDRGLLDGRTGKPRPAAQYLERLETTARNARAALGFSPASFADIQAKVAAASNTRQAALDAQVAEGRRIRERRQLEAARPTVEGLTPDVAMAEVVDHE